jgi:hypothetical protein
MTALLLAALAAQEAPDLSKLKLFVYDADRGVTLKVARDGRVDVEERRDGKVTAFGAPSVDEFRREHRDVVRRLDLDRHLPGRKTVTQQEFDEWWRKLPRGPAEDDFEAWMQRQREQMEELRRLFPRGPGAPPPAPPGRELGIRVEAVEEPLRDQFSLAADEGLTVTEVRPGTAAERAGLKVHDIVTKLDGRKVGDVWAFRKDALEALKRPSFELEVLRAGRRETLKVTP